MSTRIAQYLRGSRAASNATRIDPAAGLPARGGVGLKSQHFRDVLDTCPDVGFFEVHAENFMVDGGPFHHYLGKIREHYPLSLHGVGLSIGAEGPLDEEFFRAMAAVFVRSAPPRSPVLARYGQGFAGFIERFEPAGSVPYLADMARLGSPVATAT